MVFEFFLGLLVAFILTIPALFLPVAGDRQHYQIKNLLSVHSITISALYSIFVFLSGSLLFGGALGIFLFYIFSVVSCIKYRILKEPVYFSDIVSLGVLLKNPSFFVFSVPPVGWVVLAGLILCVPLSLWYCFTNSLYVRLYAVGIIFTACFFYKKIPVYLDISEPDWRRDVGRLGILGMLAVYWVLWKKQTAPPPVSVSKAKAGLDIVLVIQCESYATPSIFCDASVDKIRLPFLEKAKALAYSQGELLVSGFGAYTMRTEYGVMFGRTEAELGFCQYDPFLTAQRDKTYALSYQMKAAGYQTVFMHPHSLEFYGRNQLMPVIGFDAVDDCSTVQHTPLPGEYMSDTVLGEAIINRLEGATAPLFLYAVTMENHAPWPGSPQEALQHYLRHLQSSDAMLGRLMAWLEEQDKLALLVFFGDHRPSIQGIAYQDRERSTPYVALSFPECKKATSTCALTPAELHHLIRSLSLEVV